MKINKGVVSLAVVVAGIAGMSQVSAVFARGVETPHSVVLPASVAISQTRATEIAQGLLLGTVKQIHLNRGNHGKVVWKVQILSIDGTQRGSFRIDATTGDVLQSKIKPVGTSHLNQADRVVAKLEKEKLHIAEKANRLELKKKQQELKGQLSK